MLSIDPNSSVPLFEQLRDHLIARIRGGELTPGTKLPSVRGLAAELGLAPNTVAKSYRELETSGFVKTQGRNGTVVAPLLDGAEQHAQALSLARAYVSAMAALDIGEERSLEYVQQVWPN